MIQITLPAKPQKTVLSAIFEVEFHRPYTVEITKTLCSDSEPKYDVKIIQEGPSNPEVDEVIIGTVMNAASKQGVFM